MDTVLQNRELSTCRRMSLRRHRLPFGARLAALAGEAAARSGEVGCTRDHRWTIAGCDPDSARGKAGGNSHLAYGQATVSLPLE